MSLHISVGDQSDRSRGVLYEFAWVNSSLLNALGVLGAELRQTGLRRRDSKPCPALSQGKQDRLFCEPRDKPVAWRPIPDSALIHGETKLQTLSAPTALLSLDFLLRRSIPRYRNLLRRTTTKRAYSISVYKWKSQSIP